MIKRGFTIVELMVVIVVIGILTSISAVGYIAYQNRAAAAQARVLNSSVKSGSERYFSKNNEYPSAQILFGGTPSGSPPASYQTASQIIDIPAAQLDSSKVKFLPCAGAGCTFTDKAKLYYLTKSASAPTTQQQYTINGCTFTFAASEAGTGSYVTAYWDVENSTWLYSRSNNGSVTTSNTSLCPFS